MGLGYCLGGENQYPCFCYLESVASVEECRSAIQAYPSAIGSKVIGYDFGQLYGCISYFSADNRPDSCPSGWRDDYFFITDYIGNIEGTNGATNIVCYACNSTQVPNTAAPSTEIQT